MRVVVETGGRDLVRRTESPADLVPDYCNALSCMACGAETKGNTLSTRTVSCRHRGAVSSASLGDRPRRLLCRRRSLHATAQAPSKGSAARAFLEQGGGSTIAGFDCPSVGSIFGRSTVNGTCLATVAGMRLYSKREGRWHQAKFLFPSSRPFLTPPSGGTVLVR